MTKRRMIAALIVLGTIAGGLTLAIGKAPDDPTIGRSYRVPYRATDTSHFLIRVRINGKGPFNFLLDTGAPAFFVATETARKAGLKPSDTEIFTVVDKLELEGGPVLTKCQAIIEDPFQLVGMNALGLPGASIDGILGYTVLAPFRIELDPTRDRMVWTRLDMEPPRLPAEGNAKKIREEKPAEVQGLNLLGPTAKLAALLIGKQPEEIVHRRGVLGFEIRVDRERVIVSRVLAGSPAASVDLKAGDRIVSIGGRAIRSSDELHRAVERIEAGDRVTIERERDGRTETPTIKAAEGF